MATYSGMLAWRIPWTEEPGGLKSMGLHRVGPTESAHSHVLGLRCHICGLSLVAASGGYSLAVVCRLLIAVVFLVAERRLYSTDSKFAVHGHCYPVACRIFQEQGLNPCPLHWHAG